MALVLGHEAGHGDADRMLAPPAQIVNWPDIRIPAWQEGAMRTLDVLLALLGLVVLAPALVLIALAVRLTSPGSAIFRAVVIGKDGVPFRYYKFRTMRNEPGHDETHRRFIAGYVRGDRPFTVEVDAATGGVRPVYKDINNPRVTDVGRWLRRTSLDEVPQLVNVLRGEMSLVGPRPPVPYEYELYDAATRGRLAIRPGLTGLAQIRGRGTSSFTTMIESDLEYVRRRSLRVYLEVVARTVPVVLFGRGYTG
jgi:lipopolysaccharide/colanic/teichoic acid biosynthesis glycosyltransferase